MQGKLVHLRVSEALYASMKELAGSFGFQGVSDFLRDSARKNIEEYEKKQSIERLRKLKGSVKGIKRLSDAEKERVFKEYLKKDTSDIFRKYGIDNARKL